MWHINRKGLSYTSLTYVIFYLCVCGSDGKKNEIKIYRSKQDIFTNVHCNSQECTENQCKKYNAKCHRADNCDYCICSKGKVNTFMIIGKNQTRRKCRRFNAKSSGPLRYIYYSDKDPKLDFEVQKMVECTLKKNFTFTRDGQEWKTSTEELFTIEKFKRTVKIAPTKSLKPWNGSLLKLNVSCEKENSLDEYLVFLKLESLPRYQHEKHSTKESSGTNAALVIGITALTLLLVVLLLALGCLVHYSRRKRTPARQSNDNDLCVDKNSKETYENPEHIYETIDDDKLPPIPPGPTSDTYLYPQDNVIFNPSSIEHEYTYAKDSDFPKFSEDTISATKDQVKNNGDVHQNSGKPEQTSDELEYNCAGDTDTPRATSPRQDRRHENSANNTEYLPTVETEETPTNDLYKHPGANIPIEKGYVREKDANIPGVTTHKAAEPKEQGNPVYHTLEQEPATTDSYKHASTISKKKNYIHDITTAHDDSSV